MRLLLALFCTFALSLQAAQLTVKLEPLWDNQPLRLGDVSLTNAAQNKLSITRLAMLLSHAGLKRADGQWIGAADWVAFIDADKQRLSFSLNGVPPARYTALRFDIGLDPQMDKAPASQWPARHPLNPDVNAMHWSWQGQYVFVALEGRYQQPDGALGGYVYHLAGAPCRGTVEIPVELDLRSDLLLTLSLDADLFFGAQHSIDLAASDSTHSGDDEGGLAERIADNAVRAFGVLRLEPDFHAKSTAKKRESWKPAILAERIPAHFPPVEFPADNPITEAGIALGKTLFHDPRLSSNQTQSCASCHPSTSAFADPRRFSIGAEGQIGTRNAMPLLNLAWKPAYFWDGRSPTLRDQVLRPIEDPTEMHETLDNVITKISDLAPRFLEAFSSSEITAERIARALEQFLLTLISGTSRLDRTVSGGLQLSPQEQQGFQLFFTESDPGRGIRGADCFHCHGGAHFTNHLYANNGLDADTTRRDDGQGHITGKTADLGKFMVPSLRNVALTAPYMHDGRFATLDEVIDHYDHGVQRSASLDPNLAKHLRQGGLHLTPDEKAALVAFLNALTDE